MDGKGGKGEFEHGYGEMTMVAEDKQGGGCRGKDGTGRDNGKAIKQRKGERI